MVLAKKAGSKLPKRKEEFLYRGRKVSDLVKLSIEELAELLPARQRRSINRGLVKENKNLLASLKNKDLVRTHIRNMIIMPDMVGKKLEIYNGKSFEKVDVMPEMIGHLFGEFALTRNRVQHGAAGVGATRSSKYVPLK
ncbi:MAG TPA: 30S ribosomal protein S19 [Methanothrix sp.]|jgi:small subunit ribosomal protein S19|nr:30S ribosomal protein S19 [Methanothrix sp.]